MQASGLAQIEQNGTSLSVSIQTEPVLTTLVLSMRADRTHFYKKPMRHQTAIDNGTDDDKFVTALLSLSLLQRSHCDL